MAMASKEQTNAEFNLSIGRVAEAREMFHRAGILYRMLEEPDVGMPGVSGVKRGTLIAGNFVQAYSV